MSYQVSPDIEQLIRQKMASGLYGSEDELLATALQALDDDEEETQAIRQGLESVDKGEEGVPLAEAFRRLRGRHGLPE